MYCEICCKQVHFQYATEDGFVFDSRECYSKYTNKKTAERFLASLKGGTQDASSGSVPSAPQQDDSGDPVPSGVSTSLR